MYKYILFRTRKSSFRGPWRPWRRKARRLKKISVKSKKTEVN
jgi:hypothetical protein